MNECNIFLCMTIYYHTLRSLSWFILITQQCLRGAVCTVRLYPAWWLVVSRSVLGLRSTFWLLWMRAEGFPVLEKAFLAAGTSCLACGFSIDSVLADRMHLHCQAAAMWESCVMWHHHRSDFLSLAIGEKPTWGPTHIPGQELSIGTGVYRMWLRVGLLRPLMCMKTGPVAGWVGLGWTGPGEATALISWCERWGWGQNWSAVYTGMCVDWYR